VLSVRASFPRPGWWWRAPAWLAASWVAALALTFAFSVVSVVVRGGGLRTAMGAFVFLASYVAVYAALALLPLAPALVGWALLAPYADAAERRWAGVATGTGLLAGIGASVLTTVVGGASLGGAWPVAWACLLLPRVVIPALRPGAFGRAHSAPVA
jgi:hypothetical protein